MKTPSRFSAPARRRAHVLAATILFWALIVALMALAPSGAWAQAAVAPAAGDGLTTATAYQITELGNLAWMHDQAVTIATVGKYYKLMNDIDASATATLNDDGTTTDTLEGFNPIGDNSTPFNGIFLGQDHKITGLVINRPSTNFVGLFGYIGSGGKASHLGLVGGSVNGNDYVGGLVGENVGTVSECHASGSMNGNDYVGGLVGKNSGTVSECHASGSVNGNDYVGGLVGENGGGGTVSQCYATGAVNGSSVIGGLVGWNNDYGMVMECHATGAVTGNGWYLGGLVGHNNYGTVTECYATGVVTGSGSFVGDLVGFNYYGTVTECYATGAVTGITYVGGLVGVSDYGAVTECYATGAVTGNYNVGGLLGFNYYNTVSQCYATGAVTGNSGSVGGLIGGVNNASAWDSYWDAQATGQSSSPGGGTGKTTAEMKIETTFTNWDFTSVWGIQGAYPYLADLTTHTLTYAAGTHGLIGDGTTTGTTLTQVVNAGSTGTPVTAVPNAGHRFARWSDDATSVTRTDANVTDDASVTALFGEMITAAREWLGYR